MGCLPRSACFCRSLEPDSGFNHPVLKRQTLHLQWSVGGNNDTYLGLMIYLRVDFQVVGCTTRVFGFYMYVSQNVDRCTLWIADSVIPKLQLLSIPQSASSCFPCYSFFDKRTPRRGPAPLVLCNLVAAPLLVCSSSSGVISCWRLFGWGFLFWFLMQ